MKNDVIEELFGKYYNDALLYSLSLTKNRFQAEEIVSAAFFKALKTADGRIADFRPWLIRVCRNTFYSMCRKNKRYAELTEELRDESEQAVDKIILDEDYQALYRAVGLLPDLQREVVTLFYFEELPVRQIAEIVEKSVDNVKVLLYRARENLKVKLEAGHEF